MYAIKRLSVALASAALLALGPLSAHAAVVDPATGGSFDFEWSGGLGPIDFVNGAPDTGWTITLPVASTFRISTADCCNPGDAFGLIVNGAARAWDSATFDDRGFFSAFADLVLNAGTHSISLILTQLAPVPGSNDVETTGFAFVEFSAATPVAPSATVPLPAAGLMLMAGLAGLALLRRRS